MIDTFLFFFLDELCHRAKFGEGRTMRAGCRCDCSEHSNGFAHALRFGGGRLMLALPEHVPTGSVGVGGANVPAPILIHSVMTRPPSMPLIAPFTGTAVDVIRMKKFHRNKARVSSARGIKCKRCRLCALYSFYEISM